MGCETVNFPGGGYGIICGPRRRRKPCFYCKKPADWLCDFTIGLPVGLDPSEQRTCDRSICAAHRVNQGPEIDFCLCHVEDLERVANPPPIQLDLGF